MVNVLTLLLIIVGIQVLMLWEVLKWLKLIGASLGCNPHRTKRIAELLKILEDDAGYGKSARLSKEENTKLHEELKELTDSETYNGPATGGQLIQLIKRWDKFAK